MDKKATKIVAYYRVSTKTQGKSGLGLEAQRELVNGYANRIGARIVKEFTEVESGKKYERDRLKLAEAMAFVRANNGHCMLVIATIDRLARRSKLVNDLLDEGMNFRAADAPDDNELIQKIKADIAEDEANKISERTKAALAAYKARGGKLGAQLPQCQNLTAEGRARGTEAARQAIRAKAVAAYAGVLPMIRERRNAGQTLQAIAAWLNAEGYVTRQGKAFTHVQVKFILDRGEP